MSRAGPLPGTRTSSVVTTRIVVLVVGVFVDTGVPERGGLLERNRLGQAVGDTGEAVGDTGEGRRRPDPINGGGGVGGS